MLTKLKIQNIALIPKAEIEFTDGFNVLSGETGAGKSIVIGAINIILGDKVNKTIIRSGETSARVDAVFSDETLITRIIKSDGKTECRINDEIVTAATLKQTASQLINIHGQHDTATLLDPKTYVSLLDVSTDDYVAEYTEWTELKKELASIESNPRTLDLLQFQIKEIEDANLVDGEDETLQARKTHMQSFEKIKVAINNALGHEQNVGKLNSALGGVTHLDEYVERGRTIQYELDALIQDLTIYGSELEFDEDEFNRVDARLDKIKMLKRKYGATITDIMEFLKTTKTEFDNLSNAEERISKLTKRIAEQEQRMLSMGAKLTEQRNAVARTLESSMLRELGALAMEKSRLEIRLTPIAPSLNGCDAVELWFSANTGEPLKPLHQTISGGEMSRFMLALKTIQAGTGPTLVFDEIDTGIGGMVAANIANKINQIAKSTQVIVVTHLAQIAKVATSHFLIKKSEIDGKTITTVTQLDQTQREQEMQRMKGELKQ